MSKLASLLELAGNIAWSSGLRGRRDLKRQPCRRVVLGVEALEQRAVPTTVGAGQQLVVASGQTVTGINILAGGDLIVESGGTDIGTVNAGIETVEAGGKSIGATISLNADTEVFGTATGVVDNGGYLNADAGGKVISATLNEDILYVSAGGTAINTTINKGGSVTVIGGALTMGTTINGGSEFVRAGAVSDGATVSAGGFEYVFAGGLVNNLTLNAGGSGTMLGTVNTAAIAKGATLTVFDGGTTAGPIVDNGTLAFNLAGANAYAGTLTGTGDLIVQGGGSLVVSGALAGSVAATVATASKLELGAATNSNITIGYQGTLKLDHSQSFTGTVSGLAAGNQQVLDLVDVAFAKGGTSVQFAENAALTQGVLTVSDAAIGGPTVQVTLLGNYGATAFSGQAGGAAGTVINVLAPTPASAPAPTPAPGVPSDISSLVSVSNPASLKSLGGGLFLETFTVTNISSLSINARIRLSFPSLPAGVSVLATTSIAGLAPGEAQTITLEFLNTNGFDLAALLSTVPVKVLAS
jgi:autotransporter passenger strand-loop-strand repeat protein